MILKKIKVYYLFWFVALLILIIGLFSNENSVLDLNIHDTYFVISDYHVSILLFTCYFIMGIGYWLVQKAYKKQLIKSLTLIHSVIMIGSFVVYWFFIFFGRLFDKLFFRDPNFPLIEYNQLINITLFLSLVLIAFIAMPIYIVNLLIGLFGKKKIL